MKELSLEEKEATKVISDSKELLQLGIAKVPLPTDRVSLATWKKWAQELSKVTPEIVAGEGDGEYVFYRNILDEPDFPFDAILESEIGRTMVNRFGLQSLNDVRLDDAFCIQYNMNQEDTSGARHTDPSDITINLCLDKAIDTCGSQVLFYGPAPRNLSNLEKSHNSFDDNTVFLVNQDEGYATIHWGDHPHETLPLKSGQRTNIVMTFVYQDESKSGVLSRTCYG